MHTRDDLLRTLAEAWDTMNRVERAVLVGGCTGAEWEQAYQEAFTRYEAAKAALRERGVEC